MEQTTDQVISAPREPCWLMGGIADLRTRCGGLAAGQWRLAPTQPQGVFISRSCVRLKDGLRHDDKARPGRKVSDRPGARPPAARCRSINLPARATYGQENARFAPRARSLRPYRTCAQRSDGAASASRGLLYAD